MTIRLRRTLFYILTILFVVATAGIIAYAEGWRVDFESFTLQKVGAIYVRSFPAKTVITLDGEPIENEAWFFQNGTLINNLFPKKYHLELSYPGYQTWRQSLAVAPSLVSEVKYAILVPTKHETVREAGLLKSFRLIGDELLIKDPSDEWNWRGRTIPGSEIIGITGDQKRIITANALRTAFSSISLDDYTATDLIKTFKTLGITFVPKTHALVVNEESGQEVVVQRPTSATFVDLQRNRATTLPLPKGALLDHTALSRLWIALAYHASSTDAASTITILDKFLRTPQGGPITLPGKTAELFFGASNQLFILQEDGELSMHAILQNETKKIASAVRLFAVNERGTMLAAVGDTSIEVFSLTDPDEYWRFRVAHPSQITKLTWLNDTHLFLSYPDNVRFLSLEDIGLENIDPIAQTTESAFDASTRTLYYVRDGALAAIRFPE